MCKINQLNAIDYIYFYVEAMCVKMYRKMVTRHNCSNLTNNLQMFSIHITNKTLLKIIVNNEELGNELTKHF